jgi:hypothetical protein
VLTVPQLNTRLTQQTTLKLANVMTINYTAEALIQLPIKDLKQIAIQTNAEPAGDARFKTSWISGILAAVAVAVPAVEAVPAVATVSDARPGNVPDTADTDIEAEILAEIDRVADAEQAAIMSNDQDSAREFSDRLSELNDQFEAVIRAKIGALAANSMALFDSLPNSTATEAPQPPVSIIWAAPLMSGAVSIDGGQSYRQFSIIDPLTDHPIVKLVCAISEIEGDPSDRQAGVRPGVDLPLRVTANRNASNTYKVIDSRWRTTKNNRYIQAVLAELRACLGQLGTV